MEWMSKYLYGKDGEELAVYLTPELLDGNPKSGSFVYKKKTDKKFHAIKKNPHGNSRGMMGVMSPEGIQVKGFCTVNVSPMVKK